MKLRISLTTFAMATVQSVTTFILTRRTMRSGSVSPPVLRAARHRNGELNIDTREVNPGQVWEENEFWMALPGELIARLAWYSPFCRIQKTGHASYVDDTTNGFLITPFPACRKRRQRKV